MGWTTLQIKLGDLPESFVCLGHEDGFHGVHGRKDDVHSGDVSPLRDFLAEIVNVVARYPRFCPFRRRTKFFDQRGIRQLVPIAQ